MTVEASGYINAIDPTLPLGTDAKSEGDDHLRNFKKSVQDSFPNVNGAVNPTPAEFNQLSGGGLTATGIVEFLKGVDIVSATALTIGTDGNYFDVTGTTTITSIATVGVGTVVKLHFDAALTLTHNATSLVLPGGANITTAAGDEVEFIEYSTGNWRCTNYNRYNGAALVGSLVQVVHTQDGAVATGTTVIPADNTIPQITEGDQYMTISITPTSATNRLFIEHIGSFSHPDINAVMCVALFVGTTANALGCMYDESPVAYRLPRNFSVSHDMVAGVTSTLTFRVRAGGNLGTTTFNGRAGAAIYGGTIASILRVTEYIP